MIIEQSAHTAPGRARNHDVANAQRAALHEDGADRTAATLELGFDDDAFRRAMRIGAKIQNFGLQMDRFQQLVEIGALQCRNRHFERVAAHALDDDFLRQEIGAHAARIGLRLVDLVDRDDHRNLGGLGVIDRLDRLRHDAVIGRNDEHDDVRHLGAAGAHRREGFVAGRVDERDLVAVRRHDLIGADVLRDAAGLAGHDVRRADRIEQRCLAVVDVAHDRHDRSAEFQSRIVDVLVSDKADFDVSFRNALRRMAEFLNDELGGIGIDDVSDLMHRAFPHKILDQVDGAFRHAVRQFLDRDGFGYDHLARDFLARLLDTHRLEFFFFALALQRSERANLRFTIEVRDRQLLALASVIVELDCRTRHLHAARTALAAVIFFRLLARDDRPYRAGRLLDGRCVCRSRTAADRRREFDLARTACLARHVGIACGTSRGSLEGRTCAFSWRSRSGIAPLARFPWRAITRSWCGRCCRSSGGRSRSTGNGWFNLLRFRVFTSRLRLVTDGLEAHRLGIDAARLLGPRGCKRTFARGAFLVGKSPSLRLARCGCRLRWWRRWSFSCRSDRLDRCRCRSRFGAFRSRPKPARLLLLDDNGLGAPVAEVLSHMAGLDRSL